MNSMTEWNPGDGLMWQDHDAQTDLATKIAEGAASFERKFGRRPTIVLVSEELLLQEHLPELAGCKLTASPRCANNTGLFIFELEGRHVSTDIAREPRTTGVAGPDGNDDDAPGILPVADNGAGDSPVSLSDQQRESDNDSGVDVRDSRQLHVVADVQAAFQF